MEPVGPVAEGTVSQAEANRPTEALTATNIFCERPDGPGRRLTAPSGATCARTQCFPGSRKSASASRAVSLARSWTVSEQVAQKRSQPDGCMASQLSPQGLGKEMRRSLIGTILFPLPRAAMGREQPLTLSRWEREEKRRPPFPEAAFLARPVKRYATGRMRCFPTSGDRSDSRGRRGGRRDGRGGSRGDPGGRRGDHIGHSGRGC